MAPGVSRLLTRKVRRDLIRTRGPVAAVALTVLLGIAFFVATSDAYQNLETSYEATYEELNFADVWITGGPTDDIVAMLAEDRRVTTIETRRQADVPMLIKREDQHELVGRIVGLGPDGDPQLNRLDYQRGGPPGVDEVVVEHHAAGHFNILVGDKIFIPIDGQLERRVVSGIATSPEYLWVAKSRNEIIPSPDDFAVIFASDELVAAASPDSPPQVIAAVIDHRPGAAAEAADRSSQLGAVETYTRRTQPSAASLHQDVTAFGQLAVLFPLLFLSVATMATTVLLSRIIRLQQPQLGMLLACGASRRSIVVHVVGHGLTVTLLGAIPGLLLGTYAGARLTGVYTNFLDIPITSIESRPTTLAIGLAAAIAVGLVSSAVPARLAAAVTPASAMQSVGATPTGRRALLEFLIPPPLRARRLVLALRNLSRQRRRAATTALGAVLALVVVVVSVALQDTIESVLDRQFRELDARDLSLVLAETSEGDVLDELRRDPNVQTVEPYDEYDVGLVGGVYEIDVVDGEIETGQTGVSDPIGTLLSIFEPDTALHDFQGTPLSGGLVVNRHTLPHLKVGVGDLVTVLSPETRSVITLPVTGTVDEPLGVTAYVSIDDWIAAGGPPPTRVALSLRDPTTHEAARERYSLDERVLAVTDHRGLQDQVEQLLGLSRIFIGIMVVFGLIMAAALLFNAITVSLGERTGEVAVLSANGVSHGWIRSLITLETLLTISVAVVPGLLLGVAVASLFLETLNTDLFHFDLAVSSSSLVAVTAALYVTALLAQIPALSRLRRLDISAAVRERWG